MFALHPERAHFPAQPPQLLALGFTAGLLAIGLSTGPEAAGR